MSEPLCLSWCCWRCCREEADWPWPRELDVKGLTLAEGGWKWGNSGVNPDPATLLAGLWGLAAHGVECNCHKSQSCGQCHDLGRFLQTVCTELLLSICLILGQRLVLSGHLGFLATSRNPPLPVPQHCSGTQGPRYQLCALCWGIWQWWRKKLVKQEGFG